MEFTIDEIKKFILAQGAEILKHSEFLRERYGWQGTKDEAAADWARRYASEYRQVGTRLMERLAGHPRRAELFARGMSEIMIHKFLESERCGHDIGLQGAGEQWLRDHFPAWLECWGGEPPPG